MDPFRFVLIAVAGWMNQHQLHMIDYLREENRVLREQLGGRQVRLSDDQRPAYFSGIRQPPDFCRPTGCRPPIVGRSCSCESDTELSSRSDHFRHIIYVPGRTCSQGSTSPFGGLGIWPG